MSRLEKLSFIEKNTTLLLGVTRLLVDYMAILLAEGLALYTRFGVFLDVNKTFIGESNYLFTIPLIFVLFLNVQGLYKVRTQFWQIAPRIFYGCNYAMLAVVVLMYIAKTSASSSRLVMGFLWIYSFLLIALFRYLCKRYVERCSPWQLPIIIVGSGEMADALAQGIHKDSGMGYRIVGVVADEALQGKYLKDLPLLGGYEDIEAILTTSGVQKVMFAVAERPNSWTNSYLRRIQLLVKDVVYVPNLKAMPMGNLEAEALFDEKVILLGIKNNLARPWNIFVKTVFDYVLTAVGLVVISPLLLFVAWKIYNDSPGPIIYDGERIGQNGQLFKCYKFRSMYTNGDEILEKYLAEHPEKRYEWETFHKLEEDPRVTPIGNFIRKTSIDELPQLLNVLLGDMSLVGARPYLPREREEMGEAYDTIIMAKPGITGYWQVNGRSDVDFANRLNMDCWYIYNWQFWMDIALLWKTVGVVLNKSGAR